MLKQRILTALVLLAILLPALFYPDPAAFAGVVLVLMAGAAWEWGRLNGCSFAASLALSIFLTMFLAARAGVFISFASLRIDFARFPFMSFSCCIDGPP